MLMEPMPTVSVAVVNTSHFSFLATGSTPELAAASVIAAWRTHAADMGVDPDGVPDSDINVMTGPIGQAFRDGSPYPRVAEPAPRAVASREWTDRYIGHGDHAGCKPEDHDRDCDNDEDARDDQWQQLCNHCKLPIFFCWNTSTHYHVDPDAPGCALIPS